MTDSPDRPRRFDLVVFDWDGTLFDSTALIVHSIQAACRDLGLPVPDDERASWVIGLSLHGAMKHAVPDILPEQLPKMVERYRFHYLARQHDLTLFPGVGEIAAKAATIEAYVREAMAAAKAGRKVEVKPQAFDVPEELEAKFRADPKFKQAFEALTPGRQRGYLHHFTSAKQSATRTARIDKATAAIFAGRGFLERR